MKKTKTLFSSLAAILIFCFSSLAQVPDDPQKEACMLCEKLTDLDLPDVQITEVVTLEKPGKHCKVYGIIGKEIRFELLLPEMWNERFVMGGGGGFVGSVWNDMAWSVQQGYATVGTDTGHEGEAGEGSWALNNIERQANFGFLAVHLTAEVSKAIIAHYYGTNPLYSYFVGCSRGGGQALMEAQRYPDDFDGIICSGPGFDWPGMALSFIHNYQAQFPVADQKGEGILSSGSMDLLEMIILDRYDLLDGVKDNIINDPSEITMDYSMLPVCPDGLPSEDCFTKNQIGVIKTFYEGVSVNGREIYPGYPIGSESVWYSSSLALDSSVMKLGHKTWFGSFGADLFKYFVFNDPQWNLYDYDYSSFFEDTKYAASFLNATSTDYSEFKANGGKMIINHGWSDQSLTTYRTIQYYNEIKNVDKEINDYLRMYLLPGAYHCSGGVGPSWTNWLKHLRDWVEKGNAPERIVVSKNKNKEVVMTRPVFPYPGKAVYNGTGDPNVETSFNEGSSKESLMEYLVR